LGTFIVGEPERNRIVELTTGNTLIGPGSISREIGNAFSAMFKQNRWTLDEAQEGLLIFDSIPLRYIKPDLVKALKLSKQTNMYAYDTYFLAGVADPLLLTHNPISPILAPPKSDFLSNYEANGIK
jgi:hypothetical protein